MSFSNRQKDIIKSIFSGEVYDLTSFVEKYYENTKFFIDSKEVQKKKTEDFKKVRDNIADIMLELDELMRKSGKQLRKEIVQKYRKILLTHQVILDDFKRIPSPTGGGHTNFDYINKDLYLIEDYSLFDDFIYVLKYLKSENYIVVEEDKKKSQDIFRFFIYKYENEDKPRPSLESDYIRLLQASKQLNYSPHYTTFRHGYYQTDADYLDFKIQVNRDDHPKYAKYFSETIIVKPELGVFIDRGYINAQEYGLKVSHRKTNIAIGISIIIGLFSIWTSVIISKGNTEFWKANEIVENENHTEIVDILEDIEDLNNNQLSLMKTFEMKFESGNNNDIQKLVNEYSQINQNLNELTEVLKKSIELDNGGE